MKRRKLVPKLLSFRGSFYAKWVEPTWIESRWNIIRERTLHKVGQETDDLLYKSNALIKAGIIDEACD